MTDQKLLKNKILLRPDEVAAILRISTKSVYRLTKTGKLKIVRIGGAVRVFTESVQQYMGTQPDEDYTR